MECKERALLLYKFLKIYLFEQEKKWIKIIEKVDKRIKYYKDLCKIVITKESKSSNDIKFLERLNEILFSNTITTDNLTNHKEIIKELISLINEKRGEIYTMKSEVEIMEKEINFWITDFSIIKTNKQLREDITKINIEKLKFNLDEELKHKS